MFLGKTSKVLNSMRWPTFPIENKEWFIDLFPNFKGDVALWRKWNVVFDWDLEVFKKGQTTKEKKPSWIRRKLGFGTHDPESLVQEEVKEEMRFRGILKPESHINYMSFLHSNLLEVWKRTSEKLVQLYPRNSHEYLAHLKENTEIYIFTPSYPTICSLGGLDLLWPLTDILFAFSGTKFEHLHMDVFLSIRLFIESSLLYPDLRRYLELAHTDAKLEGYYRKYMDLEKRYSGLLTYHIAQWFQSKQES